MPDTAPSIQASFQPEDDDTDTTVQSFTLPATAASERLDKVLAALVPHHSRSRLQGWITDGHVLLNGLTARSRQLVGPGDCITVHEQASPESLAFSPEPIELQVVAENTDWIVVNKPAGLVTHPGAG